MRLNATIADFFKGFFLFSPIRTNCTAVQRDCRGNAATEVEKRRISLPSFHPHLPRPAEKAIGPKAKTSEPIHFCSLWKESHAADSWSPVESPCGDYTRRAKIEREEEFQVSQRKRGQAEAELKDWSAQSKMRQSPQQAAAADSLTDEDVLRLVHESR